MTNSIRLLDNTDHSIDDLLEMMMSDEFYYGYLGKVALSSSSIKLLLDSLKTYHYVTKYGSPETQALRNGWLFHTMVLEPEKMDEIVIVDVSSKNTTKYREAKKYHNLVFTRKEREDAERLCDALYKNETALSLIGKSKFEVPMIGNINGFPFRGKADILKNNGGIVDLKTTIDVKNFSKSADNFLYCNQVYIYCKLFNVSYKDFVFLCIDKKNLDIGVWECTKSFYEKGERLVAEGIERYKEYSSETFDINDYVIKGCL